MSDSVQLIDGSPPGSPVPGILQARILEWVAISFSNAWKVKVKSLSRVRLLATPWTAAYQEPTRLLCPSDFPGKSTGLGCHRLLRKCLPEKVLMNTGPWPPKDLRLWICILRLRSISPNLRAISCRCSKGSIFVGEETPRFRSCQPAREACVIALNIDRLFAHSSPSLILPLLKPVPVASAGRGIELNSFSSY